MGPIVLPMKAVRCHSTLPVSASRQRTLRRCSPGGGVPLKSRMYSPLRGSICLSVLTVVVRKTCLPQTTGDDQPLPGTFTFQATFLLVSQVLGNVALGSATPAA